MKLLNRPPRPRPKEHPFNESDRKFYWEWRRANLRESRYQPFDSGHLWPGGIPDSVKFRPGPDLPSEELKEECKAWILFVEENWVTFDAENWLTSEASGASGDPEDFFLCQRRELLVKWAEAEQSFRDAYHSRATVPESQWIGPRYPFNTMWMSKRIRWRSFVVLPRVDKGAPTNFVHWVKILLLLHRFDRPLFHSTLHNRVIDLRGCELKESSNVSNFIFAWDTVSEDSLPPARNENAARWMFLENANFEKMFMTRDGMAVIDQRGHFYMVDQRNLDEGTISLVNFAQNGEIRHEARIRPWQFDDIFLLDQNNRSCEEFEERCDDEDVGKSRATDLHLDWDAPVLKMMDSARAERCTRFDDNLADLVEHYAPGYLALEAEGREIEFDITPLTESVFGRN